MGIEILRKIGLTNGEIKVYEALGKLGRSSTGPIMDKSGISSSKVYLILEKLIQKGLVSFIIENNIKKFQITNPNNILTYLEKQQKELEKIKKDSKPFIEELTKTMGEYEEEVAQIYKGFAGLRIAFENLLGELGKGEEFLFFSQSEEELTNKKAVTFFKNLHQKRIEKGIYTKGIADNSLKEIFQKRFIKQKKFEAKFSHLTLPSAISIGKNRILLNIWGDNPICFEIVSKRIAERYREFFYKMWKVAKN
jgi:sugar-specific transcriptional regulator TrmB